MYETILGLKIWISIPAVYFSIALFFGLMSMPQYPRADLVDRLVQYFLSFMASIFLYIALVASK